MAATDNRRVGKIERRYEDIYYILITVEGKCERLAVR